jgi:hypothetical protein
VNILKNRIIDKSDPDYYNKKLLQSAQNLEKKMNMMLSKRPSKSSGLVSRQNNSA